MKIIVRISVIYIMLVYVIGITVSSYSTPVGLNDFNANDWFMFAISILFLGDIVFLWIFFLYNWGTITFKKKSHKKIWFLIILLGSIFYFVGALLYYIIVYEMEKGIVE